MDKQELQQKQQLRINWLDAIRGLAFLMVIYSHLDYCNQSIMRFFQPVFLTVFFFVSGYLVKDKLSFSKVLEQRTRTLLLPFFIFGLMLVVSGQIMSFNEHVPFTEELKGLIFQNGENEVLWFIAALYAFSIVLYGLYWISSFNVNRLVAVTLVFYVANAIYYYVGGGRLPWHIDQCGCACFYMALGLFFRYNESAITHYIDKWWVAIACLAYYCAMIVVLDLNIHFANPRYVVDALSVSLAGLVVMVYVSKHIINNSRLMLFVGANSLFYFAFHGKVYSVLQVLTRIILCDAYGPDDFVFNVAALIIVIADALILILPAMLVNRYFPFLLGKGFKLWK